MFRLYDALLFPPRVVSPDACVSCQFKVHNNMDDVLLEDVSVKMDCDMEGLEEEGCIPIKTLQSSETLSTYVIFAKDPDTFLTGVSQEFGMDQPPPSSERKQREIPFLPTNRTPTPPPPPGPTPPPPSPPSTTSTTDLNKQAGHAKRWRHTNQPAFMGPPPWR